MDNIYFSPTNGRLLLSNTYQLMRSGSQAFGVASVQQVNITLSDTSLSGTTSLTGFTDLSRMVVFESHSVTNTTPSIMYNAYHQLDAYVSAINEVTISRGATVAGISITATLFVVQFSSGTSVYKGTYSMNTSTLIHDVSIGSDILTGNTFSKHHISSTSVSRINDDGDPNDRTVSVIFLNSTTLRFQRTNSSKGSVSGHWFVVSHPELEVTHGTFSTTGDVAFGITAIDTSNTFLLASDYSTIQNYNGEALWALWTDGLFIRTDSTYEGTGEVVFYQLIKHTGLVVQQPRWATSLTTNDASITISSVDLSRTIAIDTLRSEYCQQDGYAETTLHRKFFRKTLDNNVTTSMSVTDRNGTSGVNVPWNIIQFPLIS